MVLPAADLVRLRQEHDLLLPDTCDVIRAPLVDDGAGGFTRDWDNPTVVANDAACRYSEVPSRQDQLVAERLEKAIDASLELPYAVDVTIDDKVRDVTVDGVNLGTFEVLAVQRTSWPVGRSLLIKRVGS